MGTWTDYVEATSKLHLDAEGWASPVLVGVVPLYIVTSFTITEGYDKAAIAGSSLVQFVRPSKKTIVIKALLPGLWRMLRPALEAIAMTSRFLAAGTAPLMRFTGVPVVSRTAVSLDMQVTQLKFTQDNEKRHTLQVEMTLEHAPRSRVSELVSAGLDLAVGLGTPFIP